MSKVIEELDNLIYGGQENPIVISFDITKFFQVIGEVRNELQRLEAIDNAKPNEVMECSLKLYKMVESAGNGNGFNLNEAWKCHNTIKQALIKAQEQEKVLEIIFEKRIGMWHLVDLLDQNYEMYLAFCKSEGRMIK